MVSVSQSHALNILWISQATAAIIKEAALCDFLAFLAIAIISLEISRQCGSTNSEYVHCERCREAYHDRPMHVLGLCMCTHLYTWGMHHERGGSCSKHEEFQRHKNSISGKHSRSRSVVGVRARANNTQRQRKTYFRNLHILPALHKLN